MIAKYERTLVAPSSGFFLFGVRGVGKTTWARDRFPDARRIDLLREEVFQAHLVDSRLFRRQLADVPRSSWVVVDEIQAEALVRNLPGFARFLPVASLFHGQVLNVEGLARDSGVARSTVQGYLDILEDTLLVFRIRAFEGRLRVKEKRHPKLYWLDSGVVRAARKQFHVPSPEERGSLIEGLVAQLLRASNALGLGLYDELYYWAVGKTRIEVDFLLQRGDSFIAIEVKASERLDAAAFAGLKAVAGLPGVARRILVYLGDHRFRHEAGIEVLPFAEFLDDLGKGLWP